MLIASCKVAEWENILWDNAISWLNYSFTVKVLYCSVESPGKWHSEQQHCAECYSNQSYSDEICAESYSAQIHFPEFHYAKCHSTESHSGECHLDECHGRHPLMLYMTFIVIFYFKSFLDGYSHPLTICSSNFFLSHNFKKSFTFPWHIYRRVENIRYRLGEEKTKNGSWK